MKTAIAMTSWARPHFTKQTISSLNASGARDMDLHIFQDGFFDLQTQNGVGEVLSMWEAYEHPSKIIHNSDQHLGLSPNISRALELLSEYDAIYLVEDDLIFMPGYFRTGLILYERMVAELGKPVLIQQWDKSYQTSWSQEQVERCLTDSTEWQICINAWVNIQGCFITRTAWDSFSDIWYDYKNKFVCKSLIAKTENLDELRQNAADFSALLNAPLHWPPGWGHDQIIRRMAFSRGVPFANFRTRRMLNIGDAGASLTSAQWKEWGFDLATAFPIEEEIIVNAIKNGIYRDGINDKAWFPGCDNR